jgi:hypothetical protein
MGKDSSKMMTYRAVSAGFKREAYLDLQTGIDRKLIARLRPSVHRLNVETGRYQFTTCTKQTTIRRQSLEAKLQILLRWKPRAIAATAIH